MTVPLGILQEYHDDGYAGDLVEYFHNLEERGRIKNLRRSILKRLYPEIEESITKYEDTIVSQSLGITVPLWAGKFPFMVKEVHIAYLNLEEDFLRTLVRGHEETHALGLLGRLDCLEIEVLNSYGAKIPLRRIDKQDSELAANIGAVHGLLQHGYMLEELRAYLWDDLQQALQFYKIS